MDPLWVMFGAGIMVGIAFWEALDAVATYWRERMNYQKKLWEARIEAERYIATYEEERKKNE